MATIIPFLKDQSFDPEATRVMGEAYEASLRAYRRRGDRITCSMSPLGTSRHFAATQYFGRFRGEADISERFCKPRL
jgi:hypothetical protein